MDWKVGDTLIEVTRFTREQRVRDGAVTKVGRKWVTYKVVGYWRDERFDPTNGSIDGNGFTSPGKIYRTRADYEADLALDAKRRELGELLRCANPSDYSDTKIDALKALLTGKQDA